MSLAAKKHWNCVFPQKAFPGTAKYIFTNINTYTNTPALEI